MPELTGLAAGSERADSWSVDGHKWLQLPYDCGFAIVRDAGAHRRAMDMTASYISEKPGDGRNPTQYGPELSRRARGFAAWAVLQALGRNGVADLVRHHCRLARHLADRLASEPGITVMNEVCLNQLAIAFDDPLGRIDADTMTARIVADIQGEGRSFVETATWKGRLILRVSIISAETQPEHVEELAGTIVRTWRAATA